MGELSLVLFTVLSQLAVGALVTLWLLETLGTQIKVNSGKVLTFSILGMTGIALLISLTHLGHPLKAYLALTNVGNSWLSREITMFSLFFVAVIVYLSQWKEQAQATRKIIGCIAAIIGTVSVVFSGMIYVLPAIPAWNSFSTIIFFLITTLLLGPTYVVMFLALRTEIQLPNIATLVTVSILLSVIASISYISTIYSGSVTQNMTAVNMLSSIVFWARAIIGWIIPLAIFAHYAYRKQTMNSATLATAFILLLAGELMARELFYSAVVGLQIGL